MPGSQDFFSLTPSQFEPTMSDKPLWLLDIDGVLNAYAWQGKIRKNTHKDYHKYVIPSSIDASTPAYNFWVSDTVITFINEVVAAKRVEIAWLTTWQERAQDIVAPQLGLPHFPIAGTDGGRLSDYYWKTRAGKEALYLNRPILWTDDDAITRQEKTEYTIHTRETGVEHLLIIPQPHVGLSPADLDKIDKYLTNQ